VGRRAEFLVRAELRVQVVVPFLQGKGQALFVKQFKVGLILRLVGDQDYLEAMGSAGFVGVTTGGLDIRDRANFEKQTVVGEALLMMGECCRQDVEDCLFVKF
jgi:hypothetical protein